MVRRLKLTREKALPLVCGILASGLAVLWEAKRGGLPSNSGQLFSATITVGAIAVGFLGTAKSILFSIQDREIVLQLRESGHYRKIVDYLMEAIYASLLVVVFSSVCVLVDFQEVRWFDRILFAGWAFGAGWMGGASLRILAILNRLLEADLSE